MIWVAWFMLALEILVMALSVWMMWVMVSEASRAPTDPSSPVEHPPEHPLAQPLERSMQARDDPALFALEELGAHGHAELLSDRIEMRRRVRKIRKRIRRRSGNVECGSNVACNRITVR
jgi:hypothetical protein